MATSVNFKLFGNWGRVRQLFKTLPKNLKDISIESQKAIAEKFVRVVKAHLRNQDIPGWTPLSYKYANKKITSIGSTDMLIASWTYYNSIKSWRENNLYHAGVPLGLTYPDGVEVSRVAAIHEAWARMPGKPHRPLWGYTFEEDFKGLRGIQKSLNQIFKKKLQSKGYPVTTIKL